MARTDGIIRGLTEGERALAAAVFGSALDPDVVRLRCAKWFMFQPAWVTMAPDGDVWFHPNAGLWRDDFATAILPYRALFVHELTHVWQHQQGVNLVLQRRPFAPYHYTLVPGKAFAAYGIEQQAMIVEHWYRATQTGDDETAYGALIPFANERASPRA